MVPEWLADKLKNGISVYINPLIVIDTFISEFSLLLIKLIAKNKGNISKISEIITIISPNDFTISVLVRNMNSDISMIITAATDSHFRGLNPFAIPKPTNSSCARIEMIKIAPK
jgi:hypothetical protein